MTTPRPLLRDSLHRRANRPTQRIVANADDIAQSILQVNAHERRDVAHLSITAYQRQMHRAIDVILVAAHLKRTELRLDGLLGDALDRTLLLESIADQVGDRADLEIRDACANVSRSGRRAIVPSSFRISTMTDAGSIPARRARSHPASV